MTLGDLFDHYGTDKGRNGYTDVYECLLDARRREVLAVLEVGVAKGASLRVWHDYFPNAEIFGIDIDPDCAILEPRIGAFIGDSTVASTATMLGSATFDLIIDDGSHKPFDQMATLAHFLPLVAKGGLYVIEDCPGLPSLSAEVEAIVGDEPAFFVQYQDIRAGAALCVIRKRAQ